MNRRNFLTALAGGFAVLPSALTYKRVWRATETGVLTPRDPITYCFRFVAGANGGLWKVEKWECSELGAKPLFVKELPVGEWPGDLPKGEYDQWYELSVGDTMKMIRESRKT